MIPKECKRLAEVDFPIAEVSRHAAREKSIRHGHPSTLHLWWARRPLASSRAVLMALLMPDPCDPHCPDEFKAQARELLLGMRGRPSGWNSVIQTDEGLRQILLKFIADFANWDNAAREEYLNTGRGLVKAAHPEETPLVVDPFAGGGSIPLEALRLGCEAFASDLNPVSCLILKLMLEDTPRQGPRLADELRKAGAEIEAQAEEALADLYPKDQDGATPIAYLWARTVRCEAPNCGAEIPLMRSMWLCRKPKRKQALRINVVQDEGVPPRVELEMFEPKADREVRNGTVSLARATCPCCLTALPSERLRFQITNQHGGADTVFDEQGYRVGGARLTAVVTIKPGQKGRQYRSSTNRDYEAVRLAQEHAAVILENWERDGKEGFRPMPDEPINPIRPSPNARGLSAVTRYGMSTFEDLFTTRQKMALLTFAKGVQKKQELAPGLALVLSKMTDIENSLCTWRASSEAIDHLFARQAIAMVWDFAEASPTSGATGSWESMLERSVAGTESANVTAIAQVQQADAADHPLPDESAGIWFTDPPYYDQIPYADLSDFFLVWLKRALSSHSLLTDPFDVLNPLSPKIQECVWNQSYEYEGKPKDVEFFERTITKAFAEGNRILSKDGNGIGAVVFAHQTTEGWEAFLGGLIYSGWTVTASWPIATEMATRVRAQDNASLATSVHLVCRPRSEKAPVGEWADVLRELPIRVGDWMQRLQREGIRGADLVFACIGPALEIYSRYSSVETPEGNQVALAEYLERVWEVVAREALEQVLGTAEAQARNGAADALEEDARLTALFLWTLQSTGDSKAQTEDEVDEDEPENEDPEAPTRGVSGFSMPFDVARRFAQPLGIHLEEWDSRIIQTQKGTVRLRPVTERSKELFGEAGADSMADEIENNAASSGQLSLFPDEAPTVRGRSRRATAAATQETNTPRQATTLDRVHAAMLLQASGRTEALRNLLRSEQDRGPDFLRLANALSALYPRGSEEKRLLDGMLLAVPR